jgi:hypothetical protein
LEPERGVLHVDLRIASSAMEFRVGVVAGSLSEILDADSESTVARRSIGPGKRRLLPAEARRKGLLRGFDSVEQFTGGLESVGRCLGEKPQDDVGE